MLRVSCLVVCWWACAMPWSAALAAQEAGNNVSRAVVADKQAEQPASDGQLGPPTDKGQSLDRKQRSPRLPRYFGQLGLNLQQREQVLSIQQKYDEQIDELMDKLAQLKLDRDAELTSVLTASQQQTFTTLSKPRTGNAKPVAKPAK